MKIPNLDKVDFSNWPIGHREKPMWYQDICTMSDKYRWPERLKEFDCQGEARDDRFYIELCLTKMAGLLED